jgi:serine/threonine protein kinase
MLSIPELQLITASAVTLERRIGGGGFGDVFLGTWRGVPVALKRLRLNVTCAATMRTLVAEARTLAAVRHPNSVLFLGAMIDSDGCALVTEYVPGGSVNDMIAARSSSAEAPPPLERDHALGMLGELGWDVRLFVLTSACHGMAYLHSQALIHRDLKSANLLVDDLDTPTVVKLCDFGLSLRTDGSLGATLAACGTPQWCAPEVLRADSFGRPSDVYSFGVVCWELAQMDHLPFRGMSPVRVAHEVAYNSLRLTLSPAAATACPAALVQLMESCWRESPAERPTFEACAAQLARVRAVGPTSAPHPGEVGGRDAETEPSQPAA